MAVKVSSYRTSNEKAVAVIFADAKADVVEGMEIEGKPLDLGPLLSLSLSK